MRIISGNSKGKKILKPKDIRTRPLKDLTKESIFNILNHSNKFDIQIKKSNVLDLFSGVGSFGLECLSRGSESVTFIENYKSVLPVLKKNIINLNYQNSSLVIEKDILKDLNFNVFKKSFEIIFLDPPYKEKGLILLLKKIIKSDILNKNGIIIIHRHKKEEDQYPDNFKIVEKKLYGISKIIFGYYF
jgi:16S rRNA (guanine966-N2)-methyltransferase